MGRGHDRRRGDPGRAALCERFSSVRWRVLVACTAIALCCGGMMVAGGTSPRQASAGARAANFEVPARNGDGPEMAAPAAPVDPIGSLMAAIQSGRYRDPREMAAGRLLRDLRSGAVSVGEVCDAVRPDELRAVRRGPGWILCEGPLAGPLAQRTPRVRLRFVEIDGIWKLEKIRRLEERP